VEGTVLAPYANVTFNNGVILGSLVAVNVSGYGQFNHHPYAGCAPAGDVVPTPTASPAATPSPTPAATSTPTATPSPSPAPSNLRREACLHGSLQANQEAQYKVRLFNDGSSAVSGVSARIFLDLTELYAAGLTSSDVSFEEFWDQCNQVTLGPLAAWDAQ